MLKEVRQDWDPRAESVLEDQRAAYDEMRERCPVAHSEFLGWSLFRHQDVVEAAGDPQTYSSASHHLAIPNGIDPPRHTAYCNALEPFFSPEQIAAIESAARKIAEALVDEIRVSGTTEFVGGFAHPFALKANCAFLGWPEEMWEALHGWTHGNQSASLARSREEGARLAREFAGYVLQEIDRRRTAGSNAPDDLTTSLMRATVDGQPFTDEDLVSILRNWTAGHGTVASGIEIIAWHLSRDQGLQERLRSQPAIIAAAVDEVLRVDGPLVANRRTATHSVTLNDREIPERAKLTLMWIAANRDDKAFENPYQIRLDRDQSQNLLFGSGIHYCLGAPLARLEMRIAIETLLARTSTIELDPEAVAQRAVYPSNGFHSLPLRVS